MVEAANERCSDRIVHPLGNLGWRLRSASRSSSGRNALGDALSYPVGHNALQLVEHPVLNLMAEDHAEPGDTGCDTHLAKG